MKWFFYALLSTIVYAFIPILDKINCSRLDPIIIATASSIMVSFILIIYCILQKNFFDSSCNVTYMDFIYIAATAVLTAISWAFYYGAMKFGPVSKISTMDSISFILTIVFSAFILKETIATQTIVGIVVILFGMYMVAN